MKKQKIQLVLILVLLILVVSGYFIINRMNSNNEIADEIENSDLVLNAMKVSDIVKISFYDASDEQVYVKENDKWYFEADKTFEIDQSKLETMIGYICDLTASDKIEDVNNLEDYGLAKPSNIITITSNDGTNFVVYLGDYFDITGSYFGMINSDETIYTLPYVFGTAFERNISDMIVDEYSEVDQQLSDVPFLTQ